ncbi:MAG: sulfite exporter TauE/SafE family protein [Desulfomonilaceae bacterium]
MLPFQVSVLGFTSPAVSPTNLVFNIVGIPCAVYGYFREGRMNWPLAWNIIAGTFPGLFLGMIIRILYLPDPRPFKLFAGLVLLHIGGRMVYQLIADRGAAESAAKIAEDKMRKEAILRPDNGPSQLKSSAICTISWSLTRTEYEFFGNASVSTPPVFLFCL